MFFVLLDLRPRTNGRFLFANEHNDDDDAHSGRLILSASQNPERGNPKSEPKRTEQADGCPEGIDGWLENSTVDHPQRYWVGSGDGDLVCVFLLPPVAVALFLFQLNDAHGMIVMA